MRERVQGTRPYLSGPTLCTLMRRHSVTIRILAQRMQIPMCRIRQVRRHGLTDRYAARDWIEAVTGRDPGPVEWPVDLQNLDTSGPWEEKETPGVRPRRVTSDERWTPQQSGRIFRESHQAPPRPAAPASL